MEVCSRFLVLTLWLMPINASAEVWLGSLFSTPQQRETLSYLRDTGQVTGSTTASDGTSSESQDSAQETAAGQEDGQQTAAEDQAPQIKQVVFNGVVLSAAGDVRAVWLNGQQSEKGKTDDLRVQREYPNGNLKLSAAQHSVEMKPGQHWVLSDKAANEAYQPKLESAINAAVPAQVEQALQIHKE